MKDCPICSRCLGDERTNCPEDGAPLDSVFPGAAVLDRRYRLLERLGRGGMGRVYKARHIGLQRLVAVKVLDPEHAADPGFVSRFEREAKILGLLEHPSIVAVSDFGVEPARQIPYLVMEYLEGVTLGQRLAREGPLPLAAALGTFDTVAAALDHAHLQGVLHRDLKPGNVFLVEREGKAPAVKVLDFGLSRFFADRDATAPLSPLFSPREADAGLTGPGTVLGTPGYVAPELSRSQRPTPAADLYSLGALIHTVLTGRPPPGGFASTLDSPDAEADLPKALRRPLAAALAADPSRRPPSARHLVGELRQAARRLERRRQRPRRLAAAALLGLLAVILAAVLETPLAGVEERWRDVLFALASPRVPRHPLLLVLIDDDSLATDPTPLAEMGRLLTQVLENGAAGVALDLLLPESWSRADAFSDLVVRHSGKIVLAAFSPPAGEVIGAAAVKGLTAAALGPERTAELFGFVNFDVDPDGTVRRFRTRYRGVDGRLWAAFATRAARILQSDQALGRERPPARNGKLLRIDFTLDWQGFERLSWRRLEETLAREPERFRGRLVLVGAVDSGAGDGPYRVPHPLALPAEVPGPVLQALAVHTLLDGTPVREVRRGWSSLAAGLLAALAAASVLSSRRSGTAFLSVLGWVTGWAGSTYLVFLHGRGLLPGSPVAGALVLVTAGVFLVRRRFSSKRTLQEEG